MKTTTYLLAAAALTAWPAIHTGVGTPAAPDRQAAATRADDFEWHQRMRPGQVLEIKGINGAIRAVLADGDEAEVTATKTARRSDPDDVKIEVVESGNGYTICAVYPWDRDDRPNECAAGRDGRMNSHDNDVTVNFTVRVPRGVVFRPVTVNGDVRAIGLRSDVWANTVNGDVRLSTSGRAEATTVNGSIEAELGSADWQDDVSFSTVNGHIELTLPPNASAEVRASTVNGDIETEFPLTIQGRFGPRRLRGTLGSGGHTLELKTVNGGITLKKGT